MFLFLNDGRKVNMYWVVTFYAKDNCVVYEMAKGSNQEVIEEFDSPQEAQARVDELSEKYIG